INPSIASAAVAQALMRNILYQNLSSNPSSARTVQFTLIDGAGGSSAPLATTVHVVSRSDLSVSKISSPDPVVAGYNLSYTITVTNHGPPHATAVTVMD